MRITLLLFVSAALATPHAASAAGDAGASTFESGAALYRKKPLRAEDVRVPEVRELPAEVAPAPDGSLRFPIESFDVSGNTLLAPSRIDAALAPFRGEQKQIADVQAARDALQRAYDDDGLLSVAVTIPQQTIDRGVVRLDVIEARVGEVQVENEGIAWYSAERVRAATPHIRPGVLLRRDELEADMARANAGADRSVRPALRAGAEPGTVDVALQVEDRIPLHAQLTLTNDHSPGSPDERLTAQASYGNLWGLDHQLAAFWQTTPSSRFDEMQIVGGSYSAPMPWDARQLLSYYVVYSDTRNAVVTASGVSALGKGLSMGLRYRTELPAFGLEHFGHALSFAVDRKDIDNSLESASQPAFETPITYLPFGLEYSAWASGQHALTSGQLGLTLNRAGTLPGGSRDDFRANRGGDRDVTGDFEVVNLGLEHTLRLSSLLQTLAAGRFVALPEPALALDDDATLQLRSRAQVASEPLISSEQFSAGGIDSVRGYLQSEQFGDDGWNGQLELRSWMLKDFLGGRLSERAQLVAFYDAASLHLRNAGEGQQTWTSLQAYGLGLRASLLGRLDAQLYLARPSDGTQYTADDTLEFYFQIGAGF